MPAIAMSYYMPSPHVHFDQDRLKQAGGHEPRRLQHQAGRKVGSAIGMAATSGSGLALKLHRLLCRHCSVTLELAPNNACPPPQCVSPKSTMHVARAGLAHCSPQDTSLGTLRLRTGNHAACSPITVRRPRHQRRWLTHKRVDSLRTLRACGLRSASAGVARRST